MKKLILLCVALFCSFAAYGQDRDLILTVTGDSLKCKIVELDSYEIQFRFGAGNIISIKRNEVKSYEYNFYSLKTASSKAGAFKNLPFYAGITAGISQYGSINIGDTEGFALSLGCDISYFFKKRFGVGVKFNTMSCTVDFGEMSYSDRVTFVGPAFYGRFGADRLSFTAGAGAGMLIWNIADVRASGVSIWEETAVSAGGFVSLGGNYMLTRNFGVALNVQYSLGSITNDYDIKRNPAGTGCTMGINFRF